MPTCTLKEGFSHSRKVGTAIVAMQAGEEIDLTDAGYLAFKDRFDAVKDDDDDDEKPKRTRRKKKA